MKYPNLNFDSSSIFAVLELNKFLHYIFENYITFQVHTFFNNKEVTHAIIAETKLCIKEILDYPHNKMQYISSMTNICNGNIFGYLSLWVRLGCATKKIESFKTERGIVSSVKDIHLEPISKITNEPTTQQQQQNSINRSSNRHIYIETQEKELKNNSTFYTLNEDEYREKGKVDDGKMKNVHTPGKFCVL